MTFEAWVESERGVVTRTKFLKQVAVSTGVSLQTLQFVAKGGRVSLYHKAQIISDATKGAVSIRELCE